MQLTKQLGQLHFLRAIERRHIAAFESLGDGGIDIRVSISEHAGSDPAHGEVAVGIAVQVPDVTALGLGIVGGPVLREVEFSPFAKELGRAGNEMASLGIVSLAFGNIRKGDFYS